MNFGLMNIDFDYLKESNHIGNSDYFKTKLNLNNKKMVSSLLKQKKLSHKLFRIL